MTVLHFKGINTPSVKRQRQGPIGMHCDAPKSVPDPFSSVNPSVKTSKLPLPLTLGVGTPNSAIHKAAGRCPSGSWNDPQGLFQPPAPFTAYGSFRNCTRQNHGTAGNREAGGFVNSTVNPPPPTPWCWRWCSSFYLEINVLFEITFNFTFNPLPRPRKGAFILERKRNGRRFRSVTLFPICVFILQRWVNSKRSKKNVTSLSL